MDLQSWYSIITFRNLLFSTEIATRLQLLVLQECGHRVRIYREDSSMIVIVPADFDSLGENCAQLDAKNSLSLYVTMAFFLQTSLPLMGHNSFCIYPKDWFPTMLECSTFKLYTIALSFFAKIHVCMYVYICINSHDKINVSLVLCE